VREGPFGPYLFFLLLVFFDVFFFGMLNPR